MAQLPILQSKATYKYSLHVRVSSISFGLPRRRATAARDGRCHWSRTWPTIGICSIRIPLVKHFLYEGVAVSMVDWKLLKVTCPSGYVGG